MLRTIQVVVPRFVCAGLTRHCELAMLPVPELVQIEKHPEECAVRQANPRRERDKLCHIYREDDGWDCQWQRQH